ncbi:hypothetical protein Y88_1791 [Novosphingobium nitrogenifigens DSM 19370]|uniref:Uncharacterized protein n=1 Tax=Novosphingobium nitrogenifigens DSM 19370 TaxID=983920 RepID=F1Z3W6_9SPHN|nr:hypothetical protein Y88_1791 [Novosphingobium nitrogenifigens DSM 19370]
MVGIVIRENQEFRFFLLSNNIHFGYKTTASSFDERALGKVDLLP